MIATTQTISSSEKPACASLVPRTRSSHNMAARSDANFGFKAAPESWFASVLRFRSSLRSETQARANFGLGALSSVRPADDVGGVPGSTFLPVGSITDNVVSTVLTRGAILIRTSPGIVGNDAAFEIRSVPGRGSAPPLCQRRETFRTRRIAPSVEIIEVERAAEALDLNLRRLHLGFAEVVDHARADQRHDQPDDRDDDQDFDQGEAALIAARAPTHPAGRYPQASHTRPPRRIKFHSTIWLTDNKAVMTETMRPPTTMLMVMIASGPAMPTTRSRLRCSLASKNSATRPASIGSCPVSSPKRSMRTAIVGSAAVSASASESLPPWRTRSTVLVQSVASPVVAIMSLRIRKVVVSATPLPNNTPRLRQNKAVLWKPSTGRTSGRRARERIIAARTRA